MPKEVDLSDVYKKWGDGKMSTFEACKEIHKRTGMTEPQARGKLNWYFQIERGGSTG